MSDPAWSEIAAGQAPSGAFISIVELRSGPVRDENAFVTALVLELIATSEPLPGLADARERALDFLERCERAPPWGGFAFYPADAQPRWLREPLPADVDDTALCSLALYRGGRWPQSRLRHQVLAVLDRYRLEQKPAGAEWFQTGVYPTWLNAKRLRNPIDVCANVNVATLLQASGLGESRSRGIVHMVEAALDWVADRRERMQAIMPYYSHPAELGHALRRAVSAGVSGAEDLLTRFGAQGWWQGSEDRTAPVCCSLGARVVWSSPVLQAARAWKRPRINGLD
jgi:hypothetical protein